MALPLKPECIKSWVIPKIKQQHINFNYIYDKEKTNIRDWKQATQMNTEQKHITKEDWYKKRANRYPV